MAWFDGNFITFFRDLERNNSKEWFHAHKRTYEEKVRVPFHALVEELIRRLQREDPTIQMEVKDAVFRINRDIRFSQDKSPYKTHVAAVFSPSGRRCVSEPGYYIQLSPEYVAVYGGCYRPERDGLTKIRRHLLANGEKLEKILASRDFKAKFRQLRGEENKILPREFKQAAQRQPLLYKKQFWVAADMEPETVLRRDLAAHLMKYCRTARPLNDFLWEAMHS